MCKIEPSNRERPGSKPKGDYHEQKIHNTTVSFIAPINHDGAFAAYSELNYDEFSKHKDSSEYKAAHRKLLRIKKVLCGMKDCHCGGMISTQI